MTTSNVMSVEVAIRRELEYRRKMEALQFQLQGESSWSLQEPPSVAGLKRKAPVSNLQYSPTPPPEQPSCSQRPSQNAPVSLLCKICEQAFPSTFFLKQHCKTQKHQLKLIRMKSYQRSGGSQIKDVNNPFWCSLCQIGCSSAHTLEQHLIGQKHVSGVVAMEKQKSTCEQRAEIANIEWESIMWETIS